MTSLGLALRTGINQVEVAACSAGTRTSPCNSSHVEPLLCDWCRKPFLRCDAHGGWRGMRRALAGHKGQCSARPAAEAELRERQQRWLKATAKEVLEDIALGEHGTVDLEIALLDESVAERNIDAVVKLLELRLPEYPR
jgi:hypothetical protein